MLLSWLPKAAYGIVHEATRHILKRPVVGVSAVARTRDGRILLIRRADTGTWGLPGGTLEWGETLRVALDRELEEEAGVVGPEVVRVLGAWSLPSRDPRFHAVTIAVECIVEPPNKPPKNPLEIREARLFTPEEMPPVLAFDHQDIVAAAADPGRTVLE
ncbi:MAG: ADP-ribose pyrophosphatase [Labilithrix sp.]|nr:ADP-ribose pyrophosphatase [Labilithrix sp.]